MFKLKSEIRNISFKSGYREIRVSGFGDWAIRRLGIRILNLISQFPNFQIPISRYPDNLKAIFVIMVSSLVIFFSSNVFAALPWDKVADQLLPRYPNSQLINQEDMTMNGKRAVTVNYDTQGSPQDVLNFYKENLKPKGWEVVKENRVGGVVLFKDIKGRFLVVGAISLGGKTRINVSYIFDTISRGAQDAKSSTAYEGEDMPGEDVPGISRFPGSVRTTSFKSRGTIMAGYVSRVGNFDSIVEFYRSQLTAKNWKLLDEVDVGKDALEKSKQDFKIDYEKESGEEVDIEEALPKIEYATMLVFENKSHLCLLNVIKMPDTVNTVVQYVKK